MSSKNIVAKGNTYNGVESITLPVSGGGDATFYEISDSTAVAADVAQGKYFYTSSGIKTEGTASSSAPTLITKNIIENGTYNASSDSADGYSSVTVNVSGGGSEYTLVASEEITANVSSTSVIDVGSIDVGMDAYQANHDKTKFIYTKIRDKAGKRNDYFYGVDSFVFGSQRATFSYRFVNNVLQTYAGNYGIYPDSTVDSSGTLNILGRYNSTYSKTIDGTYSVEVYLLDFADGESPYSS